MGAGGFVGSHLVKKLSGQHQIVALTRSRPSRPSTDVEWRALDLFSTQSAFEALAGIDTAIYLVHSMMPSSRLFQGDFHDTDLLLADNFARACVANNVRQIIYLGGLMPEGYVSPHLQSRREVEEVFEASGIPLTVLRAGMIVGEGGSSFEILRTLVQRLPFMVLPAWTSSTTQAIFIDDIVDVIAHAVDRVEFHGKTLDVVNGEPLTYKLLLQIMARVLGRRPWMLPVPIRSTGFSKLWVQIFGDSTAELVSPLIDSLLCDLPRVTPGPEVDPLIRYRSFEQMVQETLRRSGGAKPPPIKRKRPAVEGSVRSIQRLPSVPRHDCDWIAEEYMTWMPRVFAGLLNVKISSDHVMFEFTFRFLPRPLLILQYVRGHFEKDRQKFNVVGGLLTRTTQTGWLEFRQISQKKYTLAAIHDFVPSLPWWIYVATQAQLHKFAMHAFGRHLQEVVEAERLALAARPPGARQTEGSRETEGPPS